MKQKTRALGDFGLGMLLFLMHTLYPGRAKSFAIVKAFGCSNRWTWLLAVKQTVLLLCINRNWVIQ